MRITLEADYAVRIIDTLARSGKRLDAGSISEITGVTLRFCLKILRKLGQAGLVRSFKGVQGGYELRRQPGELTLREVIEAVDGPIYINRCLAESAQCSKMDNPQLCRYYSAFADVSKLVRDRLSGITFAQTIKDGESGKE